MPKVVANFFEAETLFQQVRGEACRNECGP